jgi:3'-phosphoadenosine 5'-phosphosulfate sulfotransferase (PAPS reductase)/FAD synthetase
VSAPRLDSYDVILVNSSAGKDSQAMLDLVVEQATAAGVRDRIVVVHADLGRVEWQGTRDLAARQAAHYGLRFEVVAREQGDLLAHVAERGMWPSSKARYCTSDHKRDQVTKLITRLVAELPTAKGTPGRVLNCIGIRAEESPTRAQLQTFERNKRASSGRRIVDTWHPIHAWTVAEVWARIAASGVEHHRAYDLGMKRLSCCFCVFAPTSALVIAGRHNRALLAEYVALEVRIGHKFKADLAIAEVAAAVDAEACS